MYHRVVLAFVNLSVFDSRDSTSRRRLPFSELPVGCVSTLVGVNHVGRFVSLHVRHLQHHQAKPLS